MDNLVILSWNVRGINNMVAQCNVRRLVNESKANVVLLQESKCLLWYNVELDKILDSNMHGWLAVNSTGLSGGLLTLWNKVDFKFSCMGNSPNWLWSEGIT